MPTRMLIDAAHAEETRVAVVRGNRIEEFDFEAQNRKQLRGNIYLAKVTRVEPSLQAAFIEYGGNRHGFLAFSEIHPDYYQIPVEDRQALIEEEARENSDSAAEDEAEIDADIKSAGAEDDGSGPEVEEVGAVDALEDMSPRRERTRARRYKIQEVIKRRQILLVQVVKEERGTKGAALTTYISLAGRYCVLMPNTARGGGISRKIGTTSDRKKLRDILSELEVPEGMGCIIRTAGSSRNKTEIKRDYQYLLRLWDNVRELTLQSIAPAIIYEEGSLLKRAIRDLYTAEIDEVLIEGREGYRTSKEFMKMLMPSHARKVKEHTDSLPIFARYQVESQLEVMFSPTVSLKSGGYLVINPTEALVAIDVNSGRATRERNVEKTAQQTNLEAAEEVARQLRLRDLAGLIVIDFIDMDENRNNRAVERKLKESLKRDRARLQVGRISPFGLMEMSRQRTRPGLLEATTQVCEICEGAGLVRTTESSALNVMRALEQEGMQGKNKQVHVAAPPDVALYLLNAKRGDLAQLEEKYDYRIKIQSDESLHRPHFNLQSEGEKRAPGQDTAVTAEAAFDANEDIDEDIDDEVDTVTKDEAPKRPRRRRRKAAEPSAVEAKADDSEVSNQPETADEEGAPKDATPRRRRRGRRGGRGRRRTGTDAAAPDQQAEAGAEQPAEAATAGSEAVTAGSEAVTAGSEAATAKSEAVTAGSEAATAKSEAVTAKSEAATAKSEAVTAKSEAATAKSEAAQPAAENQGNGQAPPVLEDSVEIATPIETPKAAKRAPRARAPKAPKAPKAVESTVLEKPEPAPSPPEAIEEIAEKKQVGEPRKGWWSR